MAAINVARYPQFAKCSNTDLAYAAGFFDGEGHIRIACQAGKRYRMDVEATQTTEAVIAWFKVTFGGSATLQEWASTHTLSKYRRWAWTSGAEHGAVFLMHIRPYLIVKATQADIALAFQATMRANGGGKRVPPETLALRQMYHDQIRQVRKDAVLVTNMGRDGSGAQASRLVEYA